MHDLTALIEPIVPNLRRYARSLLRDSAAADDLVQDCLEQAISHWHQRRADGDARTWIFTILHNLALNKIRADARRGSHISVDAVSEETLTQAAKQESTIHYGDVMSALDRLPEDQRALLLLICIEDFSYSDAAATLGIPVGTVMSRLSRARARLRQLVDGEKQSAKPTLRRVK